MYVSCMYVCLHVFCMYEESECMHVTHELHNGPYHLSGGGSFGTIQTDIHFLSIKNSTHAGACLLNDLVLWLYGLVVNSHKIRSRQNYWNKSIQHKWGFVRTSGHIRISWQSHWVLGRYQSVIGPYRHRLTFDALLLLIGLLVSAICLRASTIYILL